MTDLTTDELREACEAAGLEYDCTLVNHPEWVLRWQEEDGAYSWSWYDDDPALPAYVASLLVAKVRALDSFDVALQPTDDDGCEWMCDIYADGGHHQKDGTASVEAGPFVAIIRAALAVLREVAP